MKRLLCILCVAALLIGLLPTVTFAAANRSQSNYYSYADIVKRTYDMSYLATEPQAGEGGKQITSTDPTSRYNEETGKYENWGANGDMHGYVRFNPENGFRVLADLKGPGYLTHIETGQNWSGRLHIWIDGALVIDTAFIDFVWGDYFKEFDQLSFKSNYVNMSGFEDGYQGAVNCFVPITYNESCVVEIDCNSNSDFYYTVGYYDLEDGASVEPFAWPMSTENRNALKLANDMLSDTTVPYGGQQFENTIQPGQTATLYESAAPGAISATTLELNIPEEELDNKTSLTDWTLSMYWDGSTTPAVQMPVADFYGNSCGLYDNHFDSAGFGTDGNGVLYSKWYMPYNSVKITLKNNSAQARTVKATFRTESLTEEEANALTRFHANWQRAVARGDDRAPDAQMLYVEGKGRFVGTSLHVYQIIDGIWWGEGDEKFYIDGEKYPTWFGTGSEDYFGYAWCGSQIFDFPYCGQPHNDGDPSDGNHQVQGHGDKVNYRLHILDNVCFQSSFDANIEKYWSEESDKYAATTYFYLTRESSANHTQAPITQEERQFNDDLLTGYTLFYPGIYLLGRQLASNTATEIGTQSMAGVCEGQYTWYGNAHLFWMPASRGKAAEFLLEIPQEGNYALQGSFTTATDYGIYQLSIDGEPVGGSIDLYGAVSQKNLTVGGVTLSAGAHILKIECVGKNLSSGSYGLGLNYLKFEACEKMTYEHSLPSSSLYTALTDVTGSAYPYLFDMTGYAYSKYTWQNNQELFWKPAVGDRATFSVDISGKDTYCLEIGMTEAADFGIFELLMDGKSIGTMDTFQAGGVFGEVFRFYNLGLTVGTHTLSVVCTGKNAASANTLMGIDYIKLNTQTQVGAFYGSIGALQQAWRTDSTSAMQVQELGWFSLNMWYHNHQLYTSGTETQNFDISLPADGVYSLDVAYSTGSDYGKFQLLIDGNSIGSEINAYSAGGGVQSARIENLNLSAGAHILTVQGTGSGRVGFSYFNFTAPYESQGGEQPPVTGETLTAAQKKAVEALRSYTMQALKTCTKLQKNPLRLTMANGMMSIDAAQPEQVTEALNAAKAQIDAVLATVYEEELEVNLIDDLFFEGGDMPGWVTSCTSANPPCGQGLDPNIWSRGSHLFWVADKVGDTMELKLSVPYAMEYEAALCYTVAGDYCQYDLYLDGSKLLSIDGYAPAPGVRNVSLGKLILTKGDHVLKAVITGRNAAASGTYALGIDHILLKGDFSLLQVQKAATDYLAAYKQQKDYSAAQWQQCLACVQEFTDKINAAQSEADIRALWKNGKAALDAIATGILDFDTVEFDAGKTPGSFGWNAENNDFSAWKTDSDGQVYYVAYEGMHSKRIWKNLITDPDNFTLTLRAKVRTLRASIELMGVVVELNAEHGNGSQLFDKENWSWYYADDQICTVTLTRVNGGDLFVKLLGKGSSTAVSYTKSISNSADTNLYLGAIDNGGSAYFTEIAITGLEAQSVEDFGWDTDMVNGSKDFSGWTTFDGVNIAADYSKTVNNHRIWKNLLTDQNDFTATLDVTADNKSSAYVKLLGVTLELDGNGGDGNQVFVKLNGFNQDWLTCTGCVTNVKITRKAGGDLTFTLTGLGNDTPMTFTVTPTEQNENLELGLYRGMAKFRNICTSPVQTCEHNWILDANASVAATCTAAGTNVYTCSKCGASRSETIAALGHAWDAGKVTTEPTATEKGVRTYTCTRCGVTMTEEIPATGELRLPFTDVPEGKWYTEAVKFVYVNKLFSGTSATTFSPNNSMTRGMLVAVLWRLDGSPAPNGSNSFTDVKSGKYYENAVTWAAENKLVSGIGNGKFNPDGKVNREQIAVIIFRYAGFKGYSTEKTADLSKYPDCGKVSAWAKAALSWANAEGLIGGTVQNGATVLDPQGNATRAQVAAILMCYVNNIVNAK